jgi:hypothetical protein
MTALPSRRQNQPERPPARLAGILIDNIDRATKKT